MKKRSLLFSVVTLSTLIIGCAKESGLFTKVLNGPNVGMACALQKPAFKVGTHVLRKDCSSSYYDNDYSTCPEYYATYSYGIVIAVYSSQAKVQYLSPETSEVISTSVTDKEKLLLELKPCSGLSPDSAVLVTEKSTSYPYKDIHYSGKVKMIFQEDKILVELDTVTNGVKDVVIVDTKDISLADIES